MAKIWILKQRWDKAAAMAHFNARELARLCNVSNRELQRGFRRFFGRTPRDWLKEQRILAAQQLLRSGLSVKAVAMELRFKQASHFCRQFKSLSRMTPSEFVVKEIQNDLDCRVEITRGGRG